MRQVAPNACVKAGCDPGPGHGGFIAQALSDFEFAPIALEAAPQLLSSPTEFAQFFAHDVFGALFFGLVEFFAVNVLAIWSLHGIEEFAAKFFAAQGPAAPDFGIHFVIALPATQFHAFAEF